MLLSRSVLVKTALKWLENFLSVRVFQARINDVLPIKLFSGVIQSSITEPILYETIYQVFIKQDLSTISMFR